MKQQAPKTPKAATPASWKPGQSGNPHGRPRTGLAFAEAVRARIDPNVVLDLVERHLADESTPIAARLATVLPYVHAGFVKPPTTSDLNINGGGAPQRDYSAMPIEERREWLAKIKALPTVADVGSATQQGASESQANSTATDPRAQGVRSKSEEP